MCPDNLKRFVANLKIGAIYVLYPESFCDKNLAIRKVFAFCDSAPQTAYDFQSTGAKNIDKQKSQLINAA